MQMHNDEPTLVVEPVTENPGDTIRASWNFSQDKIRHHTAHYTTDEQEVLLALFRWCIDPQHPMRREDAARRLNCSPNLIYQLLTGVYRNPDKSLRGPAPDLIKSIQDFLELEAKRFAAGKNEFVVTPTAKRIFTACDLARESQSPVILWSTSHLGKTWALKEYKDNNNHGKTYLAELEAASGLGGMVRTLATACGVSAGKESTPALIERIKRALSPNSVLIIDEVHLLKHTYRLNSFFACIEVIRRIYDFTQCGMVLSWTNLDTLKGASQGELIQIWRRGVHKIALPNMPTKGDLAAILEHNGLSFPERDLKVTVRAGRSEIVESPYEVLRLLAKTAGLKAITERIRYARKLAHRADAKISWLFFCDAHLRIEKQSVSEEEWT